jgi:hypothetical protein
MIYIADESYPKLKNIICFIICVFWFVSESKAQYPSHISSVRPSVQEDLNIMLGISQIDSSRYEISWNQLYLESNKLKFGDKYEYLRCYVFDSKGLAGSNVYDVENIDTLCRFKTTDSQIRVVFQKRSKVHRPDITTVQKKKKPGQMEVVTPSQLLKELNFNCDYSEFEPIHITVCSKMPTELTLKNSASVVALTFINKHALNPDRMPQMGCTYDQVFHLDRYYMSMKSGKILSGKRWLHRKSIRKLCDMEFQLILPFQSYKKINGDVVIGSGMIKRKGVNLEEFKRRELLMFYLPY